METEGERRGEERESRRELSAHRGRQTEGWAGEQEGILAVGGGTPQKGGSWEVVGAEHTGGRLSVVGRCRLPRLCGVRLPTTYKLKSACYESQVK